MSHLQKQSCHLRRPPPCNFTESTELGHPAKTWSTKLHTCPTAHPKLILPSVWQPCSKHSDYTVACPDLRPHPLLAHTHPPSSLWPSPRETPQHLISPPPHPVKNTHTPQLSHRTDDREITLLLLFNNLLPSHLHVVMHTPGACCFRFVFFCFLTVTLYSSLLFSNIFQICRKNIYIYIMETLKRDYAGFCLCLSSLGQKPTLQQLH